MKHLKYFFYLIDPHSNTRVRQLRLTGVLFFSFILFFAVGSIGFVRLLWFGTSYARAKIGFYQERIENERLLSKINFLDNFLSKETKQLYELAAFEDFTRLAYGMKPISADVRRAGIGGIPSPEGSVDFIDSNHLVNKVSAVHDSLTTLLRKVQLQHSTFDQMSVYVEYLYKRWAQRPSIWPAFGKVTSGFGFRLDPISGINQIHDGLDIANELGTPVFATADGNVKEVGVMQDYGRTVVIDHPESGVETLFGHLYNYIAVKGQPVKRESSSDLSAIAGKVRDLTYITKFAKTDIR